MPGLYIHIPFCMKKCPYCDFSSFDDLLYIADDYIAALAKELVYYKNNFDLQYETLFIGGGTPTILSEKQLDSLFTAIYSVIDRKKLKETTIEANPETVTAKKAKVIEANAGRVSMGCQSFHDESLKKLCRVHDAKTIYKAYEILKKQNISHINLDLMFGVEGQSTKDVLAGIEEAAGLGPEHISFYMLTVYGHTEFGRMQERGELAVPADEVLEHMYLRGAEALEQKGYAQYEISNFAKPGKQCLHNLNYWKLGEYIGIGSAAASYFRKKRYVNIASPVEYIKRIKDGKDPAHTSEDITPEKKLKDYIMLGLRMTAGIDFNEFSGIFKFDFYQKYSSIIDKLTAQGLAEKSNDSFKLTKKGLLLSNEIIGKFF